MQHRGKSDLTDKFVKFSVRLVSYSLLTNVFTKTSRNVAHVITDITEVNTAAEGVQQAAQTGCITVHPRCFLHCQVAYADISRGVSMPSVQQEAPLT